MLKGTDKANARCIGAHTLQCKSFGTLGVAWSQDGLCNVEFRAIPKSWGIPTKRLPTWLKPLRTYIQGHVVSLNEIPIDVVGTDFQRRVWAQLRKIPRGQVCSYKDIARALKNPGGMRAVGGANGRNPVPVVVPCHRVVTSDGRLGGFSSGLAKKRQLLKMEGVDVKKDRIHVGQARLF